MFSTFLLTIVWAPDLLRQLHPALPREIRAVAFAIWQLQQSLSEIDAVVSHGMAPGALHRFPVVLFNMEKSVIHRSKPSYDVAVFWWDACMAELVADAFLQWPLAEVTENPSCFCMKFSDLLAVDPGSFCVEIDVEMRGIVPNTAFFLSFSFRMENYGSSAYSELF